MNHDIQNEFPKHFIHTNLSKLTEHLEEIQNNPRLPRTCKISYNLLYLFSINPLVCENKVNMFLLTGVRKLRLGYRSNVVGL